MKRRSLLVPLALSALFVSTTMSSASSATVSSPAPVCDGQFHQVDPPRFQGLADVTAVSALSSSDAWAVGSFEPKRTGEEWGIAMHWDGTSWTRVPLAGPRLFHPSDVAAFSATDVWAVGRRSDLHGGDSGPGIEHWDGSTWSASSVNGFGPGVLQAVDGTGPNDVWAVGYRREWRTVAAHWNGSRWTVYQTPRPSESRHVVNIALTGVAGSSPRNVWAVGSYDVGANTKTWINHWDGTAWSVVAAPKLPGEDKELDSVVALGPKRVWAVGSAANRSLVLRWDGASWTRLESPHPDTNTAFGGIDATSAGDVWAVGSSAHSVITPGWQGLATHWNGNSWAIEPTPNPSSFILLEDVSSPVPGTVFAVGYANVRLPFILQRCDP